MKKRINALEETAAQQTPSAIHIKYELQSRIETNDNNCHESIHITDISKLIYINNFNASSLPPFLLKSSSTISTNARNTNNKQPISIKQRSFSDNYFSGVNLKGEKTLILLKICYIM